MKATIDPPKRERGKDGWRFMLKITNLVSHLYCSVMSLVSLRGQILEILANINISLTKG